MKAADVRLLEVPYKGTIVWAGEARQG